MRSGGMESFQVVLKAQVVHKNALIAAVQQASLYNPVKVTEWKRWGKYIGLWQFLFVSDLYIQVYE